MTENPLHKIMNATSVAFMGASNNMTRMGTFLLLNTMAGKFEGEIYPVHPKEEIIFGLKAYKNITSLPKAVDLLVLCIPTKMVPDILEEAGQKGINRAIIVTAGYDEVGNAEGKELQKTMSAVCEKYGIRYVGPNCIGIYNGYNKLNTTVCPNTMPPGKTGMISHSGTYLSHIFSYMDMLRYNFGEGMSLGNAASIDTVDAMEYFEERENINNIAMYLEGLKYPDRFLEAAKRISLKKPIIALYAGGTEAGGRAAGTHTASMAGDGKIFDAAFKQAGVIRANTIEELIDYAWAFSTQPLPKGDRMAIVSVSGGPSTSTADMISKCQLTLPVFSQKLQEKIKKHLPHTGAGLNPVDITYSIDINTFYKHIPELILSSDEIDGLFVYGVMGPVWMGQLKALLGDKITFGELSVFEEVGNIQANQFVDVLKAYDKPVLGSTFQSTEDGMIQTVREKGIPFYPAPERAVKAMRAMLDYRRFLDKNG